MYYNGYGASPQRLIAAKQQSLNRMEEEEGLLLPPALSSACVDIRSALRQAVSDLLSRGLNQAAKWAAEQLSALPEGTTGEAQVPQGQGQQQAASATEYQSDRLLLARSLLSVGEYQRAVHSFGNDAHLLRELSPTEQFIRHYCLYLAGEKRKEEEMIKLSDPMKDIQGVSSAAAANPKGEDKGAAPMATDVMERCRVSNPNILVLHEELSALYEHGSLDGFGLYMFGIVLRGMNVTNSLQDPVNATRILVESVRKYPWNWSAWLDLAAIASEEGLPEDLEDTPLQESPWMYTFFLQRVLLERQQSSDALQHIEGLRRYFPRSSYLAAQEAEAHYIDLNYDSAIKAFQELQNRDPLRLEQLDIYSNILYVTECKAELSLLAHAAVKNDKYRPETCCIIGNYYSIKGQHEKAVIYFSRALQLDRNFQAAWTLIGHEYVEMGNTGAAIEHYRRAVDINPKDYRAWYGLGQTYEILGMYQYAIYYYRKTTALRWFDSRMWCALAVCAEKLGQREDAIKAYERAINQRDHEGDAAARLAKLYCEVGKNDLAAQCYEKIVVGKSLREVPVDEGVQAFLFLAYHYKEKGDYEQAEKYANTLLDYAGPEKEQALAILRQIRALEKHDDSNMSMNMSMAGDTPVKNSHNMSNSSLKISP
jgi:anaphase-promoting complex subunit 8